MPRLARFHSPLASIDSKTFGDLRYRCGQLELRQDDARERYAAHRAVARLQHARRATMRTS
jgi:hypothetical protein